MGFPPILFGHLKNGSFLIFSKTWCTSSQNTALTAWAFAGPACPTKSLWGRLFLYWFDLKFLLSLGITLAFPFPYYWSSSTLLYLSIRFMSWRTLVAGFLVKDFLKLRSVGRPTLKVLMAISSKSPSISLNISWYLSEYIFNVPSSCMVKDSRESKGQRTLLQVMKRELNAQVAL